MDAIPLVDIDAIFHTFDSAGEQWKTGGWIFRGHADADWELNHLPGESHYQLWIRLLFPNF